LIYLLGLTNEEIPIGGSKPIVIPKNLPGLAVKEISDVIEYIKIKYQCSDLKNN
jgi:hypothetical protein